MEGSHRVTQRLKLRPEDLGETHFQCSIDRDNLGLSLAILPRYTSKSIFIISIPHTVAFLKLNW